MDCFFVAVERKLNPALVGKPVVVGGTGPRAVVASASYESRKFGVRSAMPMAAARRLCPELVIVTPHFSEYSRVSKLIFSSLEELAPVVEQVSIDEAYLDFTGCDRLYKSREHSAAAVREKVLAVSGLACSVGVGSNKLIAKIASDHGKPNGAFVVPLGTEAQFLAPMPASRIPGVGTKTTESLRRLGILTCQDLARTPLENLKTFGSFAARMKAAASGVDSRAVTPDRERKSIGAERTFETDIENAEVFQRLLRQFAEEIATGLRARGLKARTVQLKIRYPDFSTSTRAQTFGSATDVSGEFLKVGQELLSKHKDPARPLRLLGLSVRNLVETHPAAGSSAAAADQQLSFFAETDNKVDRIEHLKDELKKKFGKAGLII